MRRRGKPSLPPSPSAGSSTRSYQHIYFPARSRLSVPVAALSAAVKAAAPDQREAALDGQLPADVIDSLLVGLVRSMETAAFPMAAAALHVAFPGRGPSPLPPFGELTGLQKRVVRTLVGLGSETWRWGNFMAIMRGWNLPDTHADCRAYAGLTGFRQMSLF